MNFNERLGHVYFFAKQEVINNGYGGEIDWQDGLCFNHITESLFLREIAWVILSCGMNAKVVTKVFPFITSAFLNFDSAQVINDNRELCKSKALAVFGNKKKIEAILFISKLINENGFAAIKSNICNQGVDYIQLLPFMGAATSWHLAKNIGLNVAKPDRHLLRIAATLGFNSPNELCTVLSEKIDEKISLIDLVLWRYATIDKNYLHTLKSQINSFHVVEA